MKQRKEVTFWMNYLIMHKDIPVVEIGLDRDTGVIETVKKIYNLDHVPVGIVVKKGMIDRASLNNWWISRAIPASRDGLKDALQEFGLSSSQELLDKCLGLSLSDQYWIQPVGSPLTWEKVNFFENAFSDDAGNILLGKHSMGKKIDLMSPDNTSDGWLRKKWKIVNGKRCLLKGGSGAIRQEPYNEVLACVVMRRLSIPHVSYQLQMLEDYPYSICEDFITPQNELISAWYIMQTQKKQNHISVYQHYLNCCNELGIPNMVEAVDRMIVLDYLIANEDRHQNNFGAIRNAETLEWIGAAPIYDSGSSLWFDKPTSMIRANIKLTCKPFKTSHEEQLKLVSSFEWLDLSNLIGIDEEFREILRDSMFVDTARCDAICKAFLGRVKMLANYMQSSTKWIPLHQNLENEIKDDIAYNG